MDIAEPTLTCPYNKAHSIISSRMQFHLTKCRIQHPTNEKTICPFNSTHVIPHVEFNCHLKFCSARIVLDAFTCKVGSSCAPKVELTTAEPIQITGDENWDVSDDPQVSVLERVHETSKNKPTLQALIGAPKSERKAFRNQERLRIQRVLDSKEKKDGQEEAQRKVEIVEGPGRKQVQGSRGRDDVGGVSEVATTTRNFNYSHNRTMNANQGQNTDYENASAIPGPSRGFRDPRNVWGPQRQNIVRPSHSRDTRDEDVATVRNSFVDANFQPPTPVQDRRDPGNPWRRVSQPSSPTVNRTDPGDFPMLPVAGRGRGRDRFRRK